jgi:hypothetical protein
MDGCSIGRDKQCACTAKCGVKIYNNYKVFDVNVKDTAENYA